MDDTQYLRTAGEAAALFRVKESTLRKYCIELEKAGYEFIKNSRGHRAFSNDDITMVQRFISAKNSPNMTLERAAKAVMDAHRDINVRVDVMGEESQQERHIDAMSKEEMREFIKAQMEFNKEIVARLDAQREREEEREKRIEERDKRLMETLSEIRETKKLPQEKEEPKEEAAAAEENSRRPWWKFW